MPAGFGTFVKKALKTSFEPPNTGFGVAGALFAGSLLQPAVERAVKPGKLGQTLEHEGAMQKQLLLRRMKEDRLKRLVQTAAARLAAADPHLYNQVLAGERLVPGEIVIGGVPRTDLLGKIAGRIALGEYDKPMPVDQQVLQFLRSR